MSKLWKALGIAALAAAVVPCKVEKDEETGVKTYHTLLSRLKVGPGKDGEGKGVRFDLLGGVVPSALGKSEEEDYADDELEMDTEPVFEMSVKVERAVPEADQADEAPEAVEAPEAPEAPEAGEAPAAAEKHGVDL